MPTDEETQAFALTQYKALLGAYDHFFELRNQLIMEFKDCQDMADQIRTALKTFADDALGTVTASQNSVPPPPNFQPLYDILTDTHNTLLAAQSKLNGVKDSAGFIPATPKTSGILFATPGVPVGSVAVSTLPLVIDGPVLPA